MRRVVFNQKGGVGKTSITCNLAAIGAALGYRTLVVDLDVQGNTTHYLVGEIDAEAFPAEAQGVAGLENPSSLRTSISASRSRVKACGSPRARLSVTASRIRMTFSRASLELPAAVRSASARAGRVHLPSQTVH